METRSIEGRGDKWLEIEHKMVKVVVRVVLVLEYLDNLMYLST